jgi:hypothetical protein
VVHHSNLEDHVHAFELRLESAPPLRIDSREIVWAGFRAETDLGTDEIWPVPRVMLAGERAPAG